MRVTGLGVAGLVLAAWAAWAGWAWWGPSRHLDALPDPFLDTVEPQVAERIRERRLAVQQRPGSAAAWGALAMSLDVHDFESEALACYGEASRLDAADFRWVYFAALVADAAGAPEAERLFAQALRLRDDYAPLHVRRGRALVQAGDAEAAERHFRRALALDRRSGFARVGLAQGLVARGELEAAAAELEAAGRERPGFPEAGSLLAQVYRRQGRVEEALRLQRALAGAGSDATRLRDPLVHDELEAQGVSAYWFDVRGRRAASRGDWETAIAEAGRAVAARPHGVFFNNLALALAGAGRLDEAIATLREAARVDPEFDLTWVNLATSLRHAGRPAEAVAALRQGLERLPGDVDLQRQLEAALAAPRAAAGDR